MQRLPISACRGRILCASRIERLGVVCNCSESEYAINVAAVDAESRNARSVRYRCFPAVGRRAYRRNRRDARVSLVSAHRITMILCCIRNDLSPTLHLIYFRRPFYTQYYTSYRLISLTWTLYLCIFTDVAAHSSTTSCVHIVDYNLYWSLDVCFFCYLAHRISNFTQREPFDFDQSFPAIRILKFSSIVYAVWPVPRCSRCRSPTFSLGGGE